MIYTVTLNPSIDYVLRLEEFRQGGVNRGTDEKFYAGGKGINVSVMLKNLGISSTALGFTAGFTGTEIERLLAQEGIQTGFVRLAGGNSRINIKLKSDTESEINGGGPPVSDGELDTFFHTLDAVRDGDILVLAGSVPTTLPNDIYERILARTAQKKLLTAVDAAGSLLTNVLGHKPFLIKPNHIELGEIFGQQLHTREEITRCAQELQSMGARNVLVSMAAQGAYLFAEDGRALFSAAPRGCCVNSVGSGDSMVAGFLAGYTQTKDYREALRLAVCCGSASAFCEGLACATEIEQLHGTMGALE